MDYQNVCDTLRKTYNINFLDLNENKIIGQEFAKAAEIYRDSKEGNKVLINLVYNHYNVKKPFPAFIGGPQTLTMHWSNKWKKVIYIFGEHHSNDIDCEKRLNTKKWLPIEDFLEDLILKTDVYLDIYFEFPAIQKSERRYYDHFKPFPADYRMDILFKRFKKYVQPGTKNDEDLVRVHYFDSRVEDHEGTRVGVSDINWFEIKTLDFTEWNLVYKLKEIVKNNARFQSVLKSLALKDDELFINFWMKQYKENKYNASALLNCPLQAEILKFIEDELRLELKKDDFVKVRNMLIKYIPHILSDTLEDGDIVTMFEFIIKSITVPKGFIADVYTLASIFKDFENVTKQPRQKNSVIIYGGNAHCEIYRKFLTYMSFEELIIASSGDEKATCVDMKKLDKPFFSDWSLIADPIINLDYNEGNKISSVSGNISLIYQGNKIPCTIETAKDKINITILGKDENCLYVEIDIIEKNAHIHTINVEGNECPLSMSSQGSFLLQLVDEISIQLGLKTVMLVDDSHIKCNGMTVSLEFLSFMKYGKSWYERHGFSYENKEKKDIINNIRNTSLNKIRNFLSTFDTNKQLELKTQWTEECLDTLYTMHPELSNQDYLDSLDENSWEKKRLKEIIEEDYEFSKLPDKIKNFLRIISEYKKEYDKDTLSDFLTYVWSKNCSDYVDILSVLYPQLPGRHGEKMYIDQSILLPLPLEEEDFYMVKFVSSNTHHKSIYLHEISESKTYTDYVTNLISYLETKPELTDLWMVIGATNNNPSDLSRFYQEYDITITGEEKVNMNETNLISLYSNDENIKKSPTKHKLYEESGSKNIYELLSNSLTIKERFSKIIYDWSTTKYILDNDKIFNELAVIKDLIALNGKLYIDTFRQSQTSPMYLKKDIASGNYYLKNDRDTIIVTPKTLKNYVGYNKGTTIRVYQDSFPIFYNPGVLFKYMNDDGSIPKTLIEEHILNASHYQDIEKTIHHTETMRRLNTIFPFPEYTIEYIENGKYPNNPSPTSILITDFYLITKKLEKPLTELKAADFGCTLPRADEIHEGAEGQRQLILLETLKKFEENGSRYHKLAFENLARWAAEAVPQSPTQKCVVIVQPGDWGEVTHALTKKYGVCFASLNMANAYGPGGGYTDGMVAQEENMFRRTDCHFAIVRKTFMRSDGSEQYTSEQSDLINGVNGRVYLDTEHPRVCIRGPENRSKSNLGYDWLADDEIFPFYELRAAAVDLRSGEAYNHNETRKRVAAQLDTLIEAGVRHVVLSAFGCGAFMNPAKYVASAYHEALKKRHMHFDVVAFGIFNAGYGPNNFAPFEAQFENWKV